MSMYQNAIDVYNENMSLHDGTVYSHRYKALLAQIAQVIRRAVAAGDIDRVYIHEKELVALDTLRSKLETKLLALYPSIATVLKSIIDGNRRNIAVAIGELDAESDGVGSKALFNMLSFPGSEAVAVERTRERIRQIA